MKHVITQNITIPAGTEFTPSQAFGDGGLEALVEINGLLVRVHLGRSNAMKNGVIVTRQEGSHLKLVSD